MNTEVVRKLIDDRLEEIEKERDELKQALTELGGRSSGGRRARSKAASSGNSSRGNSGPQAGRRRRKGGTRAEHAEKAVTDNPGIKASEIAERLKIKPNYVYRVMGDLLKEGRVTKQGTGYFPADDS